MSAWGIVKPAGSAARTDTTVDPSQFRTITGAANTPVEVTFAHGAQPSTATFSTVAYTGAAQSIADVLRPIAIGTYLEIVVPGHTFYGLCVSDKAVDGSGGKQRNLTFSDLRLFLSYDQVFGEFNILDTRAVFNPATGTVTRQRRYRHLLPANWATHRYTFTDAPLTAQTILNYLFNANTTGTAWVRQYHADLGSLPVYGISFDGGVGLDQAVAQVSERLGLTFFLAGKYLLRWVRKGELRAGDANLPWANSPFPTLTTFFGEPTFEFPPGADGCRDGWALSNHPSRLFMVGDRNKYQVLNVVLTPDWAAAWEAYFHESLWTREVFTNVIDPVTGTYYRLDARGRETGMQRAVARAMNLTLAEWVAMAPANSVFADTRKFAGRSRMALPVVYYLRHILFRAYRLPDTLLNRPTTSLEILNEQFLPVTHDSDGVMTADFTRPNDGNGYAIGRSIGLNSGSFQSIRPEFFNLTEWILTNTEWGVKNFGIDGDGQDQTPFIVFQEPVCDVQYALVQPDGSDGMVVLDVSFQPTSVPVRACLTVAAEKFLETVGTGSRDATVLEPGLSREIIWSEGQGYLGEIPYADGTYPVSRANLLGNALLLRQPSFRNGGFTRPLSFGQTGTPLNGMLDRVTVRVSGPGGSTEEVDFTTERVWRTFVPEREYSRARLSESLAPGQDELRQEAQLQRLQAAVMTNDPVARLTVIESLRRVLGQDVAPENVLVAAGAGVLKAGVPLWRDPSSAAGLSPVMPAATSDTHQTFVGVTSAENLPADAHVSVFTDGSQLMRVLGPVVVGDSVGRSNGNDYAAVVTEAAKRCGTAQQPIATATVKLIYVALGGGGGGGGTVSPRWL
jgi:hypothetical protein